MRHIRNCRQRWQILIFEFKLCRHNQSMGPRSIERLPVSIELLEGRTKSWGVLILKSGGHAASEQQRTADKYPACRHGQFPIHGVSPKRGGVYNNVDLHTLFIDLSRAQFSARSCPIYEIAQVPFRN